MRSKVMVVALMCGLGLLLACQRDFSVEPIKTSPRQLTAVEAEIVTADNQFGFDIFQKLAETSPDSNIFISPLSVAFALGMTYNGANGATEEAMRNTLGFKDWSPEEINQSFRSVIDLLMQIDPKVRFQIANSIWYRQGFDVEKDFVDVNKKYFDAEIKSLDFSSPDAPGIINDWIDQKTNGKIPKIIGSIPNYMVMYLINAIYFKGTWMYEFDKNYTQDDLFQLANGNQISCKMMNQTNDFQYLETEEFQAVDLPYGDGNFSMKIYLPKPELTLTSLISEFNTANWRAWSSRFVKAKGLVQLPKFKLEYQKELNDQLSALGMGITFTEAADFTGINKNGGLFISEVKHKTFVEVDEEGTEAAAATVVGMGLTAIGGPTLDFYMRVDRPFICTISEKHSNAILFMGKIENVDPQAVASNPYEN